MKKQFIYHFLLLIGFIIPTLSTAQLQNLDFEQCDMSKDHPFIEDICRYPLGWSRTNGSPFSFDFGFIAGNGAIKEPQSGDMALRICVWYSGLDKDMAYQRAPYSSRPVSLSGYYHYSENTVYNRDKDQVEPDTAAVLVLLSKWNHLLDRQDTIGFGVLKLNEATTYTKFNCPIEYFSDQTPDSIYILLNCSRSREEIGVVGGNAFGNSSIFTIDNLSLEETSVGLNELVGTQKWSVYPNPGHGMIHIPDFTGEASLFNLQGKLIDTRTYPGNQIDTTHLQQGAYVLRLKEQSGQINPLIYIVH